MLHYLSSIFLGLVQGIAEFLPISSSGHLALLQHFFGLSSAEETSLFFDVLLHLGTLLAIFVYYHKIIWAMIKELGTLIPAVCLASRREELKKLSPDGRMIVMIVIATLPLFLVYPVKDMVAQLYHNPLFIGFALLVTGGILFGADRMAKGRKTAKTATYVDAVLVGVGQALAVVPGISRSGATISAGLARGFSRSYAVRFSFLMSIPSVLGANLITIKDAAAQGIDTALLPAYLVGTLVAAVAGYFAIRVVNSLADKGRFGSFSFYCWGAGGAAIVATLIFH